MTRPGIRKSLEAVKALCVSVIFAEHSFRDKPRNTQCSNATAIDCMYNSVRVLLRPWCSGSVCSMYDTNYVSTSSLLTQLDLSWGCICVYFDTVVAPYAPIYTPPYAPIPPQEGKKHR